VSHIATYLTHQPLIDKRLVSLQQSSFHSSQHSLSNSMTDYKQSTQLSQSCTADHSEKHLKIWRFYISKWLKDNSIN